MYLLNGSAWTLSALDAESERLVQQALDVLQEGNLFLWIIYSYLTFVRIFSSLLFYDLFALCTGRTVLVIAHRLSTIQNAGKFIEKWLLIALVTSSYYTRFNCGIV